MNALKIAMTLGFAGLAVPMSHAGVTITAGADNRNGSIQAFGGIDPTEDGFNVDPRDIYEPINFDACVIDGSSQACLESHTQWLNLGPGASTTGFTANGELFVSKGAGGALAISDHFILVGFVVSGLSAGQTTPFTFAGSMAVDGTSASVSLTGPGVNLAFSNNANWNQTVNLANGEYALNFDAEATLSDSPFLDTESVDFTISFTQGAQPSCGGGGSCYSATGTPFCNNAECCQSVCGVDAFCCQVAWDAICVDEAAALCDSVIFAGPIINPSNGHRYDIITGPSWTAEQAFAQSFAGNLASIDDAVENQWINNNIATNIDGVARTLRIGFSDTVAEGAFFWINGQLVTFTNWALGEPNNSGNEDFAEMYPVIGQWNDVANAGGWGVAELESIACGPSAGSCFSSHGAPGCQDESCCHVVGEIDPFCIQEEWDGLCVDEANALCSPGVVTGPIVNPATGHSYYLLSPTAWSEAEEKARSMNGHLTTINDAAENEWLRLNLVSFGGFDRQPFVGLHDQAFEGTFQWLDHESVSYTNWAPGEPNNSGNEDHAVILASGVWNDQDNQGVNALNVTHAIVEVPCLGDFNGDGSVDGGDLGQLLSEWNVPGSSLDLNFDGEVDGADLGLLLGAWGACPGSSCCSSSGGLGCDQPGCTQCVCGIDPFCCDTAWDGICADEAAQECFGACQCE
jgi:hypothetical protein